MDKAKKARVAQLMAEIHELDTKHEKVAYTKRLEVHALLQGETWAEAYPVLRQVLGRGAEFNVVGCRLLATIKAQQYGGTNHATAALAKLYGIENAQ